MTWEQDNIPDFLEEIRAISKSFLTSTGSDVRHNTPSLASSATLFSANTLQKSNKIYPDDSFTSVPQSLSMEFSDAAPSAHHLDEDIKNMRIELKQSYDLFITAKDALETLNFEVIKERIKNLHLYPTEAEIDEIIKDRPLSESLEELTKTMRERFKDHPGEFCDIPELSIFFRTCSHLQRGLTNLNARMRDFDTLQGKLLNATVKADERTRKIKETLNRKSKNEDNLKK